MLEVFLSVLNIIFKSCEYSDKKSTVQRPSSQCIRLLLNDQKLRRNVSQWIVKRLPQTAKQFTE